MKNMMLLICFFTTLAFTSQLQIYDEVKKSEFLNSSNPKEIACHLNEIGVRFEQWEANEPLTVTATSEEIQKAYNADIKRLKEENGFQSVDVLKMTPDCPKKVELRQKFLKEHKHDEPEIRFFVEGSGRFFIHEEEKVFIITCEKGDLISIPENYRHWFDMGEEPYFTAIRFFTNTDGWIAHFTGDPISDSFID